MSRESTYVTLDVNATSRERERVEERSKQRQGERKKEKQSDKEEERERIGERDIGKPHELRARVAVDERWCTP